MTKVKTKFLILALIMILSLGTVSFAENATDEIPSPEPRTTAEEGVEPISNEENPEEVPGNNEENPEEVPENNEGDPEDVPEDTSGSPEEQTQIHEDDLFLTGNDVTMDKLVDGNVFIFANHAKITGQVAGNVYVFANTVEFENAYIQASVYVFANTVKYGAVSYDLYAACSSLEIPDNFGVYRDLNVTCNTFNLSGVISRNAKVSANKIEFTSRALVYGDFNYTSSSKIELPESAVEGDINYTESYRNVPTSQEKIVTAIVSAIAAVVLAFIIYGLAKWLTPSALEKASKVFSAKWIQAFVIGLVTIILAPIVSVLLMITVVGAPVAFLTLVLYGILLAISIPVLTVTIAKAIATKMGKDKVPMQLLWIAVVSVILYAVRYIPYAGSIILMLAGILGFGILVLTLFFKKINFEKKEKDNKELAEKPKKEEKNK